MYIKSKLFKPFEQTIDIKWHKRFLKMAREIAMWSKDTSTKCGCILVKDKRILATGYNGFVTGTEDYDNHKKHERPEKYYWFEHAERNAIYSAAKQGIQLDGAIAYVTGPPCVDCTRAMIQAGISCIYIPMKHNMTNRDVSGDKWAEQSRRCESMMLNAGVDYLGVEIDEDG